jgi:hypothetical protein
MQPKKHLSQQHRLEMQKMQQRQIKRRGDHVMATAEQIKAFNDKTAAISYNTGRSIGVAPSIVQGQASLESNYGLSYLAAAFNNFFGIKAGDSWKGETITLPTNEEVNGKMVLSEAKFRVYATPEDSFNDYKSVLGAQRYSNLAGKDYKTAAQLLHADGYATDSKYGEKLIGRIEANKYHYNDIKIDASGIPLKNKSVIESTFSNVYGDLTPEQSKAAYANEAALNPPAFDPASFDVLGGVGKFLFNKGLMILVILVIVVVIIIAVAKMTGADEKIKEGATLAAKAAVVA